MSFQLEKDVDFAWVSADFGSGLETYKITHYTLPLILQLLKKYGHRDKPDWRWVDCKNNNIESKKEPIDWRNECLDDGETKRWRRINLGKEYVKNEYDLTDAESLAMREEAICTVLLDWKEGVIQKKDGKNVLCGEKEKRQLVVYSPARIEWILSQAILPGTFHPDEEQTAKNSERPLNTENGAPATKSNSRVAETVSK